MKGRVTLGSNLAFINKKTINKSKASIVCQICCSPHWYIETVSKFTVDWYLLNSLLIVRCATKIVFGQSLQLLPAPVLSQIETKTLI